MIITSSPKNKLLLGDNNKKINKRLLSTVDINNSILVIDFTYYCSLIANKLKYSSSFGEKWSDLVGSSDRLRALQAVDDIFEPILSIKRLVEIKNLVLLTKPTKDFSIFEKELFKVFSGIISYYIETTNKVSSLYSIAVQEKQKYIILTDDVSFWSICSQKSKICFCTVIKNNKVRFYFDKFGLEYLSSLIQTNKIVNKLRLSKLKYVNLQYLFLLLLYVKFKQVKMKEELDISDKQFLGAKGKALQLLTTAHKEISYYFLTKPDIMEIFLTSSITHFTLNLSRLKKLTQFDITLLSGFAAYYNYSKITQIDVIKTKPKTVYYKLIEHSKLFCFQDIEKPEKNKKVSLPQEPIQSDISSLETSLAVNQILKDLAW